MAERAEALTTEEGAIVVERLFDAPRELVWKARTEPERVIPWRGPNGLSLLAWLAGVHLEIVEPERIVFSGDLGLCGEKLPEAAGKITFRRT